LRPQTVPPPNLPPQFPTQPTPALLYTDPMPPTAIALIAVSVLALALAAALVWSLLTRARAQSDLASQAATAAERLATAQAETARIQAERESTARTAAELEQRLADRERETASIISALSNDKAVLAERLSNLDQIRAELAKNEARMKEVFAALSADQLKASRTEFLAQAKPVFDAATKQHADLAKPIEETLRLTRERLESIEKTRVESAARIAEQIDQMTGANNTLRDETGRLTRALSRPEIRGQYGEIQLRRVAELAGMTSYCDFTEQTTVRDDDGNMLRPDMVVKLPNERVIVVDAKTNTYAYLEAVNAKDDTERAHHLERFGKHVADQAKKLADKDYWSQFDGSPDFVVMFIPGDHFIDAALQQRPDLIDTAAQHGVILASPSTLIGLLRAVAVGWREHRLADEARALFELGKELHERAAVAFEHAGKLGDSIRQSVERYNKFVGSIDTRMMPTLKRFEDAGARSGKQLAEPKSVDATPRMLEAGEG
ncbi:MAG: DNA recombination protein RmuC, partial [Phycisphaerales bacterium]